MGVDNLFDRALAASPRRSADLERTSLGKAALLEAAEAEADAPTVSSNGKFMGQGPFGATHYLKAAFGGAVCCSLTHGGTTPIDVIKTRMQLDPTKYTSFLGTYKSIV